MAVSKLVDILKLINFVLTKHLTNKPMKKLTTTQAASINGGLKTGGYSDEN
jgi:hypothetical protein